jgi:hypothetical protein
MIPPPEHLDRYSLTIPRDMADECLAWWSWLIPADLRPATLTKFGDWILQDVEGKLHFLDLLEGVLAPLDAHTPDLQDPVFISKFRDHLSVDWVEVCLTNRMMLEPEQCYGWKIHPRIGGAFASANIQRFSFRVYQSLNAQLHQQFTGRHGKDITGFTIKEG